MYHTAVALRREHPTWGSGYIRVRLGMKDSDQPLPAERTLRAWFRKAGLSAAPAGRRPVLNLDRATRPHQVWQMDASECLRLKSGHHVCWLRVIDEFSGAILWTRVFNKARWETVPAVETQQALRDTFRRWEMPGGFRLDNGFPWGTSKDLPTDLRLWLTGLDIAMDYNPPACPQKNGVVERSMRTSQNWAEPGGCDSWQELQQRVDEADQIQREVYPLPAGRSRLETFPELASKDRTYTKKWERDHWSLELVWDYMSEFAWPRRVDRAGQVSMYRQRYYVGKDRARTTIQVSFDPLTGEWVFSEDSGTLIRTGIAEELTQARIVGLTVNPDRYKQAAKK